MPSATPKKLSGVVKILRKRVDFGLAVDIAALLSTISSEISASSAGKSVSLSFEVMASSYKKEIGELCLSYLICKLFFRSPQK